MRLCTYVVLDDETIHTMCMRNVINIRPVQHAHIILTIVFLQPSTPRCIRRLVSEKIPTNRIGFVLKPFFFFFKKHINFYCKKLDFRRSTPLLLSRTRDELYYCAVDIFAEIDRTKKIIYIYIFWIVQTSARKTGTRLLYARGCVANNTPADPSVATRRHPIGRQTCCRATMPRTSFKIKKLNRARSKR